MAGERRPSCSQFAEKTYGPAAAPYRAPCGEWLGTGNATARPYVSSVKLASWLENGGLLVHSLPRRHTALPRLRTERLVASGWAPVMPRQDRMSPRSNWPHGWRTAAFLFTVCREDIRPCRGSVPSALWRVVGHR